MAAAHEALDLATEHGDPTLLAQVAPAVLYALWAPGRRELRARVAAQAIRAAESTGDPRLEFGAHLSAYNIAVESADHVVAARSLARMRAIAHAVAEPRLRWTVGLYDTFDATMAGRLDEAEALATANLDLGMQIGEPDAFTFFAGQLFVIGTFAGRHEELLPLVEQAANDSPGVVPFKLAYGIICAAVGRDDVARDILSRRPVDPLQRDLGRQHVDDVGHRLRGARDRARRRRSRGTLLPIIEPFATDVAFNGVTSQGPVAAYMGKLASLLGEHEVAEQHLLAALDIATAFGWKYHRGHDVVRTRASAAPPGRRARPRRRSVARRSVGAVPSGRVSELDARRSTRSPGSALGEHPHRVGPNAVVLHGFGRAGRVHRLLEELHARDLDDQPDAIRLLGVDERASRDTQRPEDLVTLR